MLLKSSLNSLLSSLENRDKHIDILDALLRKETWSSREKQRLFAALTSLLCDEKFTESVAFHFRHLLKELLSRVERNELCPNKLFVALSKLIGHYHDANEFAYSYFKRKPFSPFQRTRNAKKRKSENLEQVSELTLLIAAFNFLWFDADWFANAWDWSPVFSFTDCDDRDLQWIALQCIRILTSMSDYEFKQWIASLIDRETEASLRVKYNHLFTDRKLKFCAPLESLNETHESLDFENSRLSDDIALVCGLTLSKLTNENKHNDKRIMIVPSFEKHLKSLALSVSFGDPVLIQGPIGCGKTSLIEYLASQTNRINPPHLTKLQMGDQIDGKLLIGTHCCTDIPGEFIWKPGPLTESVINGHWLVLEDIDCASPDIISILSSVIKTKSLSSLTCCPVTTYKPNENFRIFFTRRLIGNHSETQQSIMNENLFSLCKIINMDVMNREELRTIIDSLWPNLAVISEKILDIYYIIQEQASNENTTSFLSTISRKVSSHDLFKWCNRISENFCLNSDESTLNIFFNAADCFLNCFPSMIKRISIAEILGVKLNMTSFNSRFFLCQRKPDLQTDEKELRIGRIKLKKNLDSTFEKCHSKPFFAFTRQSLNLIEKIAVCVYHNEPILLVGETGTGKTSSVQYLAHLLNKKLTVINMNQQSDSCDLLGGYKPVEFKLIIQPLRTEFEDLFSLTFDVIENSKFLTHISDCFQSRKWSSLLSLMIHVQKKALFKSFDDESIIERWKSFGVKINRLYSLGSDNPVLGFSFVEGSLVNAMKKGEWILLDEINLAETETLQCLSSILDTNQNSLLLMDKADGSLVEKHPNFRLFACMNPATDFGKKELPLGIRHRFSEFFVEEMEDENDLQILVNSYLNGLISPSQISKIVSFYLDVRKEAENSLCDTNGSRPHYSLRTLCRALRVCASNPCFNIQRSLFEAFSLSFLTQLNSSSYTKVKSLIASHLLGGKKELSVIKSQIQPPTNVDDFILCQGFWISRGKEKPFTDANYIITSSIRRNLIDLARIVSIGKTFPILIQGETSVGKTSLIKWLAQVTGNICLRVNNHEHTDLQEYIGSYCVDANGKLVFKEGVLVEAMRKGYWIILDELNLASTEVLEALNRVLDDNRELFIPETQEVIKAHQKFIIFATQNPPENYAGRKMLSRAFRNRFIELHFDEIPSKELETILHQKCHLPLSYAVKMVGTLTELRVRRRESSLFYGKNSFITLRDLFRWGERYKLFADDFHGDFYDWDLYLANEGYMLLAGRVRKSEEASIVKEVLESKFKRKIDVDALFSSLFQNMVGDSLSHNNKFHHLVWTQNLKRLAVLMFSALKNKEPVLLIGETGGGKTTMCQLFASLQNLPLYSVNCHMHSESSDFLGSLRPVRNHNENETRLFEWVDGPLVEAMKKGGVFLVDEISLADDSVLERLNSVLEPERSLLLAERTAEEDDSLQKSNIICAQNSFSFIGTMNPGGDYGKKELSPALRNRFTEIWCPSETSYEEIILIVKHNLSNWITSKDEISEVIAKFFVWYTKSGFSQISTTSIRDILSIVEFINKVTSFLSINPLLPHVAVFHAISLVFIDSLGTGNVSSISDTHEEKKICLSYLNSCIKLVFKSLPHAVKENFLIDHEKYFGIDPFYIPFHQKERNVHIDFQFDSPNASLNALKLLRALQIDKPLLLEGSPGVGKTSLVQALAKVTGHDVVRINLSEQTDISDLFGADLPIEGSEGKFAWRDGPLLQALKSNGTWIILDELNLASQSVLEGLNACLDHRGEIFIPELSKTFLIKKSITRIFACQNPYKQGGARKGLPQSFLNRFTIILIDNMTTNDLQFILSRTFPTLMPELVKNLVVFNEKLIDRFEKSQNSNSVPFEFNLRDLFRCCQLLLNTSLNNVSQFNLAYAVNLVYAQRFRTAEDRSIVYEVCKEVIGLCPLNCSPDYYLTESFFIIGEAILPRKGSSTSRNFNILHKQLQYLEFITKCIEMNWMVILSGPSEIGKTTLVSILALITGNSLKILSVNPEMDAIDLLGGFEQQDLTLHLKHIENEIWRCIQFTLKSIILSSDKTEHVTTLMKLWFDYVHFSTELSMDANNKSLLQRIEALEVISKTLCERNHLSFENIYISLSTLKDKCLSHRVGASGKFEWIDSVLVKALQNGDWLLIDEVNLCPASVFDRLNSLLEPNGELNLTEKGVVDGNIPIVKPHPNFRLIIAMDPVNGELSRAMRNRGIEIYFSPSFNDRDLILQLKSLGFQSDLLHKMFSMYPTFEIENANIQKEKIFFRFCSETVQEFHRKINNNKIISDMRALDGLIADKPYHFDTFDRRIRSILGDVIFADVFQDSLSIVQYLQGKEDLCSLSTALQIFFERASLRDMETRKLLAIKTFGKNPFNLCIFKEIYEFIATRIGRQVYNKVQFEEFSCEMFKTSSLKKFLFCSGFNEEHLKMVDNLFNRWLLILFWNKIKQIETSESQQNISFFNRSKAYAEDETSIDLSNEFERHIYEFISIHDRKIFDELIHLEPTLEDVFHIERSLFWFHDFCLMCHGKIQQYSSNDFLVLWLLLSEKCFNTKRFQSIFSFDKISLKISTSLKLNTFEDEKFYRIMWKFNNTLSLFSNETEATLFQKLTEISYLILSFPNIREIIFNCFHWITTLTTCFANLSKEDFHDEILNQIEKILCAIKSNHLLSFSKSKIESDEEEDEELLKTLQNRNIMIESFLVPLWHLCFCFVHAEDILEKKNKSSTYISKHKLLLNPIHKYLLNIYPNVDCTNELLLNYLLTFQRFSNTKFFSFWLDDENKTSCIENVTYETIANHEFTAECTPNLSIISTRLISKTATLGNLNVKKSELRNLLKFLWFNYEHLTSKKSFNLLYRYRQVVLFWCSFIKKCCESFDFGGKILFENALQILSDDNIDHSSLGYAFALVGLITCHLFAPLTSVDPILRSKYKLRHYEMELRYINVELTLRNEFSVNKRGQPLNENNNSYISNLLSRKRTLEKKIEQLERKYRFRPKVSQFEKLRNSVKHFLNTVLTIDKFADFIYSLKEDKTKIETLIRKSLQTQASIMNFCNNLITSYPLYSDITNNLLIGTCIVLQGLKIMTHELKNKLLLEKWSLSCKDEYVNHIRSLASFSNLNPIANATKLLSTINWISSHLKEITVTFPRTNTLLFKCAFLEVKNGLAIGLSRDSIFSVISIVLKAFLKAWETEEEKRRLKKEEEDALYELKARTVTGELSEEQQDNLDIAEKFPTFSEDYSDFIDRDVLNTNTPNEVGVRNDLSISPHSNDYLEIFELHEFILNTLSSDTININPDFVKPYKLRYEVFGHLLAYGGHSFGPNVDLDSIDGHIIMCNEELSDASAEKFSKKNYNIYKDCFPEELYSCQRALHIFETKVISLLSEFPGHPTLRKLLKITDRIFGFALSGCSVIKCVTGLELLLETSNEWELKAHKGISLRNEIEEITDLIIRWRKMELNNWLLCLDSVDMKFREEQLLKWWFHFYIIITAILHDQNSEEDTFRNLLSSLEQFLENSKLGEFIVRLNLIKNFEQHIIFFDSERKCPQLINLLQNIYRFYSQFCDNILAKISKDRIPIEKEVKDLVKIMRWNDSNFYSLKNAVDKSHRSIHRTMKNYEKLLSQPAKDNFCLTENKIKSVRPWQLNLNKDVIEQQEIPHLTAVGDYEHLSRADKYLKKGINLSETIINNAQCLEAEILYINDFATIIIETLQDFNTYSLPDQLVDKEKWKKAVRQLRHSKQQCLSDLWKELSKCGLSFRKGINYFNDISNDNIMINVPAFNYGDRLSNNCIEDLKSADHYFYSSLARFTSLRISLEAPSKELTINEFDRIKGFTGHLLSIIVSNRRLFATELDYFYKTQKIANCFELVGNSFGSINQEEVFIWITAARNLVNELRANLYQFKSFLSCYPENNENVLFLANDSFFLYFKDHCESMRIMVEDECDKLKTLPMHIFPDGIKDLTIITQDDFNQLELMFSELKRIANNFIKSNLNNFCQDSKFSIPMQLLRTCFKINEDVAKFENFCSSQIIQIQKQEIVPEVVQKGESLLLFLLKTIESLLKLELAVENQNGAENENVLKNNCKITEIFNAFRIKKLLHNLQDFLAATRKLNGNYSENEKKKLEELINCLKNFFHLYFCLSRYFISLIAAFQRSTNKFFYILLCLFNDLSQKGFCLPVEIEEDKNNQSEQIKFEDITDGGLGEGEGVNDVSEKVESEDVLEDTFKAGQENDSKNEENQNIEEAEHGIEMSEDFNAKTFSPKVEETNENSEESEDEIDKNELDKKFGEVEDEDETIDERIWGSDGEEENEEKDKNNSDHKGGEDFSETRLMAKEGDSSTEEADGNDDHKSIEDDQDDPNEINEAQTDDYEGERQDPYKNTSEKDNKDEPMDPSEFPEEMELDANEIEEETLEGSPMDEEVEENEGDAEMDETVDEEMLEEENALNDNIETENDNEVESTEMENEEKENIEETSEENKDENEEAVMASKDTPFSDILSNVESLPKNDQNSNTVAEESIQEKNTGRADFAETNEGAEGNGITTVISKQSKEKESSKKPEKTSNDKQALEDYRQSDLQRKPILEASDSHTIKPDSCIDKNEEKSQTYQHLNENETGTDEVIDIANAEEENKYRPNREDEKGAEEENFEQNDPEDMNVIENLEKGREKEANEVLKNKSQNQKTKKTPKETEPLNSNINEEFFKLDSELVSTAEVGRGPNSTIHTQKELLLFNEKAELKESWFEDLMKAVRESKDSTEKQEIRQLWQEIENKVNPLVRELCQQLQLVLEPTKMSKLKGDYKTGKRLNMRKVIAYIASQFRKDKIWLRRTKPNKRQYQIILAVDDSSSMMDNKSKIFAFESLALLAKSLSLIEAGQLAVMSFGEETKLLHSFDEPYTQSTGAAILSHFEFNQQRTRVVELLNKAVALSMKHRNSYRELSQLLLIISDGRGLFNEGEENVRRAVRQMKSFGIFVVFIILDNPLNKDSILDIKVPVFDESGRVKIETYMEKFPFPFYLILRDINSMPQVLGEALRQWFELVTSSDRL
ncbi:hypothetical protein B4U79_11757 [Dinothrombium tinctorium]|uniref:Midasin n=1 Tax=Dinothrombium tinctorium TaxID=1965070 RepID=A0A3S3PEG1_9ACAR|nr:hypothetical protein B4U79_11757 [Dinothrombium tinctorium]